MGYYVQMQSVDFDIPETPDVLEALRSVNEKFDLDYLENDLTSVENLFNALGFEIDSFDLTGTGRSTVRLTGYDNKYHEEIDLFLAAVAPFMSEDSYTVWEGDSDDRWRWIIKDGKLYTQQAQEAWDEPYLSEAQTKLLQ
jgi:hypothetical protein